MSVQPPHDPRQGHPHQGWNPSEQPRPQGPYGPTGQQGPPQPQQPSPPPGGAPHPGAVPQPGYAGPPGGQPPFGRYPRPGGQEQPGGGGNKRRNLLIGGAAGVVVLLVAVSGITWAVTAPRVYTAFPDCDEAFLAEMFEDALDSPDLEVAGEFEPEEDPDEVSFGELSCSVGSDGELSVLSVRIDLADPEHEEYGELQEEVLDTLDEIEAELPPGEVGVLSTQNFEYSEAVWRPVSFGDGGVSLAVLEDGYQGPSILGSSVFITDNAVVGVSWYLGADQDVTDVLDQVHAISEDVHGQVRRVGETE